MSQVYVSHKVDPGREVSFRLAVYDGESYTLADATALDCYSTPSGGRFTMRCSPGYYEVSVEGVTRWLIKVPRTPGTYDLLELVVRDITPESERYLKLGGGRMVGPLLLHGHPEEGDSPLQAATKDYVDRVASEGELIFNQFSPVSTKQLKHNLNKHPEVRVIAQDGTRMYPAISYPDENTIRLDFASNESFTAYVN